jgi:hypothetical protein
VRTEERTIPRQDDARSVHDHTPLLAERATAFGAQVEYDEGLAEPTRDLRALQGLAIILLRSGDQGMRLPRADILEGRTPRLLSLGRLRRLGPGHRPWILDVIEDKEHSDDCREDEEDGEEPKGDASGWQPRFES